MKRLALLVPLILFVWMVYFFVKALPEDPTRIPSAMVGQPFPAFTLPTLTGSVKDQTVLAGKMHLVNVWATWCVACKAEHPFFMKLAKQGIPIMGIDYKEQDNGDDARAWLKDLGDPYVFSVFDNRGQLALNLGVTGAPETFLVDAAGIIRYRHTGILTPKSWQEVFVPLLDDSLLEGTASEARQSVNNESGVQ